MTLKRDLLLNRDGKRTTRSDTSPQLLADDEVRRWIHAFRATTSLRHDDLQDAAFATEYLARRRDAHIRVFEFAGVATGILVALLAISAADKQWFATVVSTVLAVSTLVYAGVAARGIQRTDRQLDGILDVTTRLPEVPKPPVEMRIPIQHVRLGSWSVIRFRE